MRRISRSCSRSKRAIPTGPNVRFLVDNAALPADCGAYERLVVVFNGDDGDALASARAAWIDCKSRGFEVTYWQADERGRWQRRGKRGWGINDNLKFRAAPCDIVTVVPQSDGGTGA